MGASNIWEASVWPASKLRDLPRTVNISARIRTLSKAQRRAVFEALKADQPDIADMVTRMGKAFGPLELSLDPETAGRVLDAAGIDCGMKS